MHYRRAASFSGSRLDIHPSARKHGVTDADIRHAVRNAIAIVWWDSDRRLYLGPARSAALLEVITLERSDDLESAIHAMPMRRQYRGVLMRGER
ncbi:MAG: hypothetical protein EXQ77_01155 [Thermoleophilia bacterium]|nr:hypothetical protein [Thermoleophilia bacterium]